MELKDNQGFGKNNQAVQDELLKIIEQLEWCGYECQGGPLEMNTAFVRLKEIAHEDVFPAKLDRSKLKACRMCDSAFTNPELTPDNDLSYWSIGKCEKGYRMFIRSGDGKPVEILVEKWNDGAGWQIIGHYCPQYCPECGLPITEEAWAELERRIGGNDGTTDNE